MFYDVFTIIHDVIITSNPNSYTTLLVIIETIKINKLNIER